MFSLSPSKYLLATILRNGEVPRSNFTILVNAILYQAFHLPWKFGQWMDAGGLHELYRKYLQLFGNPDKL